jgi:hypothetical protein
VEKGGLLLLLLLFDCIVLIQHVAIKTLAEEQNKQIRHTPCTFDGHGTSTEWKQSHLYPLATEKYSHP